MVRQSILSEYSREFELRNEKGLPPESSALQIKALPQTGVPEGLLRELGRVLTDLPTSLEPHRVVKSLYRQRAKMLEMGLVDWAVAEQLAWASAAREGFHVRLSGQDVERGTFSHRHAVVHDQRRPDTKYTSLHEIRDAAPIELCNSSLSEYGVLGFEFGYSLERPDALVMWEAQFGDFANTAQCIIDQFVVAAEAKWQAESGIVLLLPHGLEGGSDCQDLNSRPASSTHPKLRCRPSWDAHRSTPTHHPSPQRAPHHVTLSRPSIPCLTHLRHWFRPTATCASTCLSVWPLALAAHPAGGPEHSSARPERYLQLCDDDERIGAPTGGAMDPQLQLQQSNLTVANVTTPANYFHLLRRQLGSLWLDTNSHSRRSETRGPAHQCARALVWQRGPSGNRWCCCPPSRCYDTRTCDPAWPRWGRARASARCYQRFRSRSSCRPIACGGSSSARAACM